MTDTGQVPGEGLPESAGMVEQPGVPAHGAYTYLSENPAEDEDLLLPGSQGAWGNELPPPAPEPVVEAVHEPGPHETSGRDSGSVDLGGVLHPDPVATPPVAPTPPRRPLHLGPPTPDGSGSPVRSLADRGPTGAPVRQQGAPTSGPEYLDVPQPREMAPQGAAPWGARAQAVAAPHPGPVGAGDPAAETVVPVAEAGDAAQAAVARLAAQVGGAAATYGPDAGRAPDAGQAPDAVHAPDAGQAPHGQQGAQPQHGADGGEAAVPAPEATFAPAGGPEGAPAPADGGPVDAGTPADGQASGPAQEGHQGQEPGDRQGQEPGGGPAVPVGQTPEDGYAPEDGAATACVVDSVEVAPAPGTTAEVAQSPGAEHVPEAGPDGAYEPGAAGVNAPETGPAAATAPAPEAGRVTGSEAGQVADAAHAAEAGQTVDPAHAVPGGHTPQADQHPAAVQAPEAQLPPTAQAAAQPNGPAPAPDGPQAAAPASEAPEAGSAPAASGTAPATASVAGHPQADGRPADTASTVQGPQLGQAGEQEQAPGAGRQPVADAPVDPAQPQVAEADPRGAQAAPAAAPTAHIADPAVHDPNTASAAQTTALGDPQVRPTQPSAAEAAHASAAPDAAASDPAQAAPAQPADQPQSALPTGPASADGADQPQTAPPTAPAHPDSAPAGRQSGEQAGDEGPFTEPSAVEQQGTAAGTDGPGAAPQGGEGHEAATPAGEAPGEQGHGAPRTGGGVPLEAEPGQPLGRFVPVEGFVPTTPHLAPTPPQPLVLPGQQQHTEESPRPTAVPGEPVATVPAPRGADTAPAVAGEEPETVVAQHADDLDTQVADQEESTAAVEEAPQSTGPAAPGYAEAERDAVLKVMRERRDIRNGFRSDPIPHEVLLRVLEAAHTAPSVGHSQPWDFVVIRSADTRRAMHELAMRQREAYAKSLPKGRAKQFKELKIEAILDTPVNIVVTADPTRGGRHTLGRHTQPQMAPYSSALAVENLWLAARAEGLGVGWVSFFDEREMVRALGLPEHLEVVAYLCVGYVDEFPAEPELMQAGWSKRRPLSWVVHEETYGRRALPGEDPHDLLAETVAGIRPLDAKALGEAWERQKRMTKPAGALGMLEIISAQLSGLSRQCPPPIPEPAAVAIFAGDHGVHAQGVTPWPQEVTAQMVANFLGGGAVCNAFAGQVGAEVCVVDVGVAADLPATPGLLPRKIRAGTSDMTTGPAMTREEAKQAIEVGIETARDLVAAGNKALLTGEMGIANTTASAALISVFTGADPAEVTGRGTGINDETLARKTDVVRRAIELHQPDPADPIGVLAAIGGFEHAAMVGLLLGGASLRTPVILDGVSAGAAALVARAIAPEVLAACIAGHRSAEPGHVAALNKLGLRPLVDLDLRLGEGTGALLALPLVQSTARAMHEVATFDSAGVTEK
ncbi:nicotinate-nucleotide--dimethylbenzimidazole phosphoribosyltransferase [Streptomyces sp. NPDC046197]|uniref:nicotinate-nucleotide--dimethylbenzimidazole phosphoribosyltransferase n=1 Tax=Streptomyces sp. NPDC046197 TaxID=3154337 RepID=UPI0033DC05DE